MHLPDFSVLASDGSTYTQAFFNTGLFVIFIYPKDMTSGCTLEAKAFSGLIPTFAKANTTVFGLSKDSLKSHAKFCVKEDLNVVLLSDESRDFLTKLGVMKEKSMFGKKYMGVVRTTLVILDGKIIKRYDKVKADGHAEEVLAFVQEVNANN